MEKRTDGLLFKFAIIFTVFTIVTLLLIGITSYVNQMDSYKRQCEVSIRNIGEYLADLLTEDGETFITYQNYYMEHFAEVDIPYDFAECVTARKTFDTLMAREHPGKAVGVDIAFSELSPEAQKAYFMYYHEFWLLAFEKARKDFGIPYTYYLVPKEEEYIMVYMIDGERTRKKEEGKENFLYLGDEYYDDPKVYTVQWEAWFSGKKPEGYQVWNNEWGHTYAYYTPLIINGKKLGLIGTEISVETVNKAILKDTFKQIFGIGVTQVLCTALLLWLIYYAYIFKIHTLELNVREYTSHKDSSIAATIEENVSGRDEISSLAQQIAVMILEIENYMKSLLATSEELSTTKQLAEEMNELAFKDALTGVRNKASYDSEVRRLEWAMVDPSLEFGIVMIDLNFLKRINDSFGHEQGNRAIKKLCGIVCNSFKHSPVFRIGGDEFVVILEKADYKSREHLVAAFNEALAAQDKEKGLEPWERVSAAIGLAVYDPEKDSAVATVFKRADKAMYLRKKAMKAVRES